VGAGRGRRLRGRHHQFAQEELGEVVFVELPEVGQVFDAGDEIGTIESVKAVAEVYTPVAGEIVEVNEAARRRPAGAQRGPARRRLAGEDPVLGLVGLDELMERRGVRGLHQGVRK
jgi:glycine cleavage system H protein